MHLLFPLKTSGMCAVFAQTDFTRISLIVMALSHFKTKLVHIMGKNKGRVSISIDKYRGISVLHDVSYSLVSLLTIEQEGHICNAEALPLTEALPLYLSYSKQPV